jgi:malonyl-CoA O-methyltransferase
MQRSPARRRLRDERSAIAGRPATVSLPEGYGLPDPAVAQGRFDRAARSVDQADFVGAEAAARLIERLALFSLEPAVVVDVGAGTGRVSGQLAALYPDAAVVAIDISRPMLERAASIGAVVRLVADAHRLPCASGSVDLVFSNLLLPWVAPDLVLAECARVLKPGGLAIMTTLGPDTLVELRRAWASVDAFIHVHGFIDMHDIGDLASRAGLVEPVIDVDRLTLDYADVDGLVGDLRAAGVANSAVGRCPGLVSRKRWAQFDAALRADAPDGRIAMSVELVFLQAFAPDPTGPRVAPTNGETRIGVDALVDQARKRR